MDTTATENTQAADIAKGAETAAMGEEANASETRQADTKDAVTAEKAKAAAEANPLEIQRKKLGLTLDDLSEACGVTVNVLKYVINTPEAEILTKESIARRMGDALDIKHEKAKKALQDALTAESQAA